VEPDENLMEQLRLAEEIHDPQTGLGELLLKGARLAELVQQLDRSLSTGGTPPRRLNAFV